jgi:hypothetical protein
VTKYIYLEIKVTSRDSIHEEIESRLNSGNASHHIFRNLLSSRLLPKNLKIETYKAVTSSVILCMCENLSLTKMAVFWVAARVTW